MFTFLDLLVIVGMALAAASLLCLCLMFLVRNKRVKQVCLYIVAALGIYMGYVAIQINWPYYMGQAILAVVLALVSIGSVVLERLSKGDEKRLLIARIMAGAALVIGFANALLV